MLEPAGSNVSIGEIISNLKGKHEYNLVSRFEGAPKADGVRE